MGELIAFSQSSLLLLPHSPPSSLRSGPHLSNCSLPVCFSSTKLIKNPIYHAERKQRSWMTPANVISDSKVPTTFTVDSAGGGIDVFPDSGGADNNFGGGGGGNGGGGDGENHDGDESRDDQSGGPEKKQGMSMSQKLTLGYAALVGIGGAMGYIKGGSKKSLIAGGLSASILYYVYTLLPSNPVLASSIGLVLSASLLGVMGSRFKRSGKVFPAGVVSFASLIMSGGYLHGVMRSMH
ncbi:hypothetical protein ACS0TY_027903 [Phlomoides rotata]